MFSEFELRVVHGGFFSTRNFHEKPDARTLDKEIKFNIKAVRNYIKRNEYEKSSHD